MSLLRLKVSKDIAKTLLYILYNSMSKKVSLFKSPFEEYYQKVPENKNDTIGFDLRSAYNTLPDSIMQKFINDPTFHLTDEFKTPSHITFSTSSRDKSVKGGEWKEENGKWVFYAAPINVKNGLHYEGGIEGYFKKYEPNAKLVMPK